ncbi:MAG: prepilin-type N-terminal cleavage/methylation domain-containing protein, partial [Planctomycetaceae bacterium]
MSADSGRFCAFWCRLAERVMIQRQQQQRQCSAAGFSLLELLLALAVLVAVSAIAFPPLMDRLHSLPLHHPPPP